MRLKLALWLCLALSFGVAQAQTPGTFAPNSQLGSTALNGRFGTKADATNPVITGTLTLGGTAITGFGIGVGQAPQFIDWNGSGFPGWHQTSRLIFDQPVTTANDFALFQLSRTTTFSEPASASINHVIRVGTTIGANDGTQEWGITSNVVTSGNVGGGIVGGFFQASRTVGSTDFITGLIGSAIDNTNLGTAASGVSNLAGLEVDALGNSADDAVNFATFGGQGVRKAIHVAFGRQNPANTTQTEVSNGLWFTTSTGGTSGGNDVHTNYQSVIGFGLNTQIRQALDTRGAIPPTGVSDPVAAVRMSAGQIVDFNGGASLISAPGDYMAWDAATSKLKYYHLGVAKWSVDTSGNVRAAGTVTASVTP